MSEPQVLSMADLDVIEDRAVSECRDMQQRVLEIDVFNLIATVRLAWLNNAGLLSQVADVRAECAAMREALTEYATREHWVNDLQDEFHRYQGWECANDALALNAGAQWLERYKYFQRACNEAVLVIEHALNPYAKDALERLSDFLDKYKEETP